MKNVILFYDINKINFVNYIHDILKVMALRNDCRVLLAYEEDSCDAKSDEALSHYEMFKVNAWNRIQTLFTEYSPSLVVVNAQRIPDSLLIACSKVRGVPTLMIQHGMYNGFLARQPSLFFGKLAKTFKYFWYALNIGVETKKNPITVALQLVLVFVGNKSSKWLADNVPEIFADTVHVYGDYWIEYHRDFLGYRPEITKFVVTGYPKLKIKLRTDSQYDVCYIAQTLVEDGRASPEQMLTTYNLLTRLNYNCSLITKLHPRSDSLMFDKCGLDVTDELPAAKVYLGHYSSLLATPLSQGKQVCLLPINGHEIPAYFLEACTVVNSEEEVLAKVSENNARSDRDISHVFSHPMPAEDHVDVILSLCRSSGHCIPIN